MILRYFRLFVILILAAVGQQAVATSDMAMSLYERLEHMPSEQLMKMGGRYYYTTRQLDSALVCFSIVANRYYQGKQGQADIENAIQAMENMAWLYAEEFYDYSKAMIYNVQARELSEKHQCDRFMPEILMTEAGLEDMSYQFSNNHQFNEKNLDRTKEAFYLAKDQKNWPVMLTAFMNMMIHTTFNGKESLIEREMNIIKAIDIPENDGFLKYERCMIDGVRARANNQADSALACFQRLIGIAQKEMKGKYSIRTQITANNYIAEWYLAQHQDAEYINTLKNIERQALECNDIYALLSNYKNFADFYTQRNNQELAQHYHILYLEGKDELLNKRRLSNANEAKFLYELNKKNAETREMAQRERVKSRVMWGALAFVIVLAVLLVLLWLNNRRINERNRQLYAKSLEILRADEEKRLLIEQLQGQLAPVEADDDAPYKSSHVPNEAKMSDLMHRVFLVMETSDEIYSPDFSLPRLAELVGDTRNNVSEAINQQYRTNFNGLLNEYRIKEACRRLNNPAQWGHLTIEAIAMSLGFKSRSGFSTIFKQITGLTPGAYQRMHH